MKNKEHGIFSNVLFFMSLKHAQLWKSVKKVFLHILYLMQKSYQWGQQAYLIQNMCRYDSYRVQSADIVLEKKD